MRLQELDPEFARARAWAWKKGMKAAFLLTSLMWASWLAAVMTPLGHWLHGIYPRQPESIDGILLAPLIHNDLAHLMSNSLPIFLAVVALFGNYPHSARRVVPAAWILTGTLVWLFARPAWHAGASGILYALLAFLFISGFLRRDKQSVSISMVLVFLYGGLIFGIIPDKPNISWESHLAGLLVGIALAWWFRKQDIPVFRRYDLDDAEDTNDPTGTNTSVPNQAATRTIPPENHRSKHSHRTHR